MNENKNFWQFFAGNKVKVLFVPHALIHGRIQNVNFLKLKVSYLWNLPIQLFLKWFICFKNTHSRLLLLFWLLWKRQNNRNVLPCYQSASSGWKCVVSYLYKSKNLSTIWAKSICFFKALLSYRRFDNISISIHWKDYS